MFDWLYALGTTDLFVVAVNSTIVDLGNSILKSLNDIKFPLLPLSILCENFVLFWLVLNVILVNITNITLWNVKDLILSQSSFSSPLSKDFLLFVHLMHASGLLGCWFCFHSFPGILTYCFEMILLTKCTACLTKCWILPLSVCCTTIILVLLSEYSHPFVCGESLYAFYLI